MDATIPIAGGDLPGYLATPVPDVAGTPPWPGVVVVHDAFGLGDDVKAITARFATAGYLAVTPDLYSRGRKLQCMRSTFAQLRRGSGPAVADLVAARDFLRARDDCTGAVGVVGFCMGGGFALLLAPQFDASAPYYGSLPQDPHLLDDACPVVASYGRRDPSLRGTAARLESALSERGIPHDVKEYPDAGHGFANRLPGVLGMVMGVTGSGYHHDVAEDAWQRVLRFFADHLEQQDPS